MLAESAVREAMRVHFGRLTPDMPLAPAVGALPISSDFFVLNRPELGVAGRT